MFVTFPNPHPGSLARPSTPPRPQKCYEPRNVPWLLTLSLFSPQTHIWVYQEAWERVNDHLLFAPNMAGFSVSCVAFKSTNANCIPLTMDIKKNLFVEVSNHILAMKFKLHVHLFLLMEQQFTKSWGLPCHHYIYFV